MGKKSTTISVFKPTVTWDHPFNHICSYLLSTQFKKRLFTKEHEIKPTKRQANGGYTSGTVPLTQPWLIPASDLRKWHFTIPVQQSDTIHSDQRQHTVRMNCCLIIHMSFVPSTHTKRYQWSKPYHILWRPRYCARVLTFTHRMSNYSSGPRLPGRKVLKCHYQKATLKFCPLKPIKSHEIPARSNENHEIPAKSHENHEIPAKSHDIPIQSLEQI